MTIAARHIDITTEDITCANGMPAFLAYPTGGGKFPTVVLMHERYGLVKHTKDQAMRCARDGFTVLAPNFFYKHPDQKIAQRRRRPLRHDRSGIERADARRAGDAEDPQGGRPEQGHRHGLLPDRAASAGVRRRDADHRRRGLVRRGLDARVGASTSCSRRRWKRSSPRSTARCSAPSAKATTSSRSTTCCASAIAWRPTRRATTSTSIAARRTAGSTTPCPAATARPRPRPAGPRSSASSPEVFSGQWDGVVRWQFASDSGKDYDFSKNVRME